MTIFRTVRLLTRYTAWANRLMFSAVTELPPGEAVKERPSVFPTIVHTLNHSFIIQRVFQAHLLGEPHGFTARNTPTCPPLKDLWQSQRTLDDWYVAWSDTVTEPSLGERVQFTFIGGGEGNMTREQMVLHLVNHTTYHHGYVGDMFYQIPIEPPTTDLSIFLRDCPEYGL